LAITAWWLKNPYEKYDIVSWDDYYSQYDGKNRIHVPNHQPDKIKCSSPFDLGMAVFKKLLESMIGILL
jgi:hypothetical protein